MDNATVVCLMGPTAVGKTALACQLARHANMEIISVDSALVYREMNIGTAKPSIDELSLAPHHLIDIIDPPETYSAANFCADAHKLCQQILAQGKTPLLVGGTMMYFNALQQGLSALPEANPSIREQLLQEAAQIGWDGLHQRLAQVDEVAAQKIHPNDTQRIQRALEVYAITGKSLTSLLIPAAPTTNYKYINLALLPEERSFLHERIAIRFKAMLELGFIAEVENIVTKWSLTEAHPALRCVGYRQVFDYLQGAYDYDLLCDKGIAATRQLAKRQLTWLRSWRSLNIFNAESPPSLDRVMDLVFK